MLKKTIEPALKKGIEAITNHKFTIGMDGGGTLKCCFGNLDDAYTKVSLQMKNDTWMAPFCSFRVILGLFGLNKY